MKIHLSYVAARDRATGKISMLVSVESLLGGADVSPIARLIGDFTGGSPEGAELRAKYSHVLAVVENQERQVLEFPDPAIALRERKAAEIAAAKRQVEDRTTTELAAKAAAAGVKALTAERKEAEARVTELEAELQSIMPAPAAPLLPAPPIVELPPPPPETPEETLAKLTDEQLVAVAAQYAIEVASPLDREATITTILAAAPQ